MKTTSPRQNGSRASAARRVASRHRIASRHRKVSLCEVLDRVLNKGAVIAGDLVISVAGIDLLYVGLNVIVSSVETMRVRGAPGAQSAQSAQGARA